jgi:hypothetical protein
MLSSAVLLLKSGRWFGVSSAQAARAIAEIVREDIDDQRNETEGQRKGKNTSTASRKFSTGDSAQGEGSHTGHSERKPRKTTSPPRQEVGESCQLIREACARVWYEVNGIFLR